MLINLVTSPFPSKVFINKKKPEFSKLAAELVKLESHLLLWIAKYKAWIPEHNEHALVYMADENEHGLGFPSGIDERVDDVVNKF